MLVRVLLWILLLNYSLVNTPRRMAVWYIWKMDIQTIMVIQEKLYKGMWRLSLLSD